MAEMENQMRKLLW